MRTHPIILEFIFGATVGYLYLWFQQQTITTHHEPDLQGNYIADYSDTNKSYDGMTAESINGLFNEKLDFLQTVIQKPGLNCLLLSSNDLGHQGDVFNLGLLDFTMDSSLEKFDIGYNQLDTLETTAPGFIKSLTEKVADIHTNTKLKVILRGNSVIEQALVRISQQQIETKKLNVDLQAKSNSSSKPIAESQQQISSVNNCAALFGTTYKNLTQGSPTNKTKESPGFIEKIKNFFTA